MLDVPLINSRFGGRYRRAGEVVLFKSGPILYRRVGEVAMLTVWGKKLYRRINSVRAFGPFVVSR